jgi:hypothetical protein
MNSLRQQSAAEFAQSRQLLLGAIAFVHGGAKLVNSIEVHEFLGRERCSKPAHGFFAGDAQRLGLPRGEPSGKLSCAKQIVVGRISIF